MALATAQDYITMAFRRIGQMRPGYTPQPELLSDAMDQWTVLFDEWNAERTLNYSMPDYVFPITGSGHGSTGNAQTFGGTGYSIGLTALDFAVPRPVEIAKMNLYLTSANPAQPARIPMRKLNSMEEWGSITVIQLTPINVATCFFYDKQFPNAVIWMWPPINGNSVEIFAWGQLAPPAALATPYAAPPGYAEAIIWSLAEAFWPLCTHDFMPHKLTLAYVHGRAYAAKQKIRGINAPKPRLISDFQGGRSGPDGLDLIVTGGIT